jgi:hypothetical protein
VIRGIAQNVDGKLDRLEAGRRSSPGMSVADRQGQSWKTADCTDARIAQNVDDKLDHLEAEAALFRRYVGGGQAGAIVESDRLHGRTK